MKAAVVLLLAVATTTAYAESPEQLTQTARNVARDGRCEALPAIGARVRALDADYYTRVFALDPVIVGCMHVDAHLQLGGPPSLTPLRIAAPRVLGEPKSPDRALGMSLGLTAGGLGLMIAGGSMGSAPLGVAGAAMFVIGPTTGHIYAGHAANAGLGVRAIGALTAVVGTGLLLQCIDECHGQGHADVGAVLFIGGGLLYTGGMIGEIATAPEATHRYNREHGFEATVVPTGNGLALAGRF